MERPKNYTQIIHNDDVLELSFVVVPLVTLWFLSILGAITSLWNSSSTSHRHMDLEFVKNKRKHNWKTDVEQLEP